MKSCWLLPIVILVGLARPSHAQEVVQASGKSRSQARCPTAGYLVSCKEQTTGVESLEFTPYQPQPGDLILYDNTNKFHHILYKIANTSAPIHAAMVITRSDDSLALLELTGPWSVTAKVVILDVEPRLATYPGTVMVRRLRHPLAPEQAHELSCFAEAQVGKHFAIGRILLLGTPFNAHKGLRRNLFGKTYFNRNRWFCSELVVAAGTTANVFDPQSHPANAIYPRDLAYDDQLDLCELYYPPVSWLPERPH